MINSVEEVMNNVIARWGSFGILLVYALYIIYGKVKAELFNDNKDYKGISRDTDVIISKSNEVLYELKAEIGVLNKKVDRMEELTDYKIEKLEGKIDNIKDSIKSQPGKIIDSLDDYNNKEREAHNQKILTQLQVGPMLHRIMGKYLDLIGCDHIVIGVFHNGTSTLTGVPFCKFDIISEKFKSYVGGHDVEYAPMYKNVDVLLHNKLPAILVQDDYVIYEVREDADCLLQSVDDILYRRLLGRGIQGLALNIMRDFNDIPIGFIGCIKYNDADMDKNEVKKCTKEIEDVYNKYMG